MATLWDNEWIDLADEILNQDTDFNYLRRSFVIKKDGDYNPTTKKEEGAESYPALATPMEIQSASNKFVNITVDSVYVTVYKGSTRPVKLDSSYYCVYDGKTMSIAEVNPNSANAIWELRLEK